MAKKAPSAPTYHWGDIGGRTTHPADPSGVLFGKSHWPQAMPHEKFDVTGKTAGRAVAVPAPQPVSESATAGRETAVKQPSTTTGLVTREDFLDEAVRLGVSSAELNAKIAIAFRDAPNEGMKRMRSNNLLRNAVKRLRQDQQ